MTFEIKREKSGGFDIQGVPTDLSLLRRRYDDPVLETAAAVVAHYCDGKEESSLRVAYEDSDSNGFIETSPAQDGFWGEIRI